jgi:hypothetical protein
MPETGQFSRNLGRDDDSSSVTWGAGWSLVPQGGVGEGTIGPAETTMPTSHAQGSMTPSQFPKGRCPINGLLAPPTGPLGVFVARARFGMET